MIEWIVAALGLFSPPTETCLNNCKTGYAGYAIIREFEGYSPVVYLDPVGKATIGYGHLLLPGETFREPLLPHEAQALLEKDVAIKEEIVNRYVTVPLKTNQFDALTSIMFNVGPGKTGHKSGIVRLKSGKPSTLLRFVNAERHADVPEQIMRWVYAAGRVLNGLVRRREAEAELYAG